jgi:Calx-beta domain/Domain of unknown function (DUF4214)
MKQQNSEMCPNGYSTFLRHAIKATVSVVIVLGAIAIFGSAARAATFQVTTIADNNNNASPTAGSLRKAIIDANNNPGQDTIDFNIPGSGVHKITVTVALPVISDPVVIDGYTQPGAVQNSLANNDNAQLMIEIASTGAVIDGIVISAGSSTVRGLLITGFAKPNSFGGTGITLKSKGGNMIAGNFIGTDANGTNAIPNYVGVFVNSCDNNVIGGSQPAARNLISGNASTGVTIQGNGAYNNLVLGNFIGTNRSASGALGNGDTGVLVFDPGTASSAGEIGGTTAGAGNVISGNVSAGIGTIGNTTGLKIQGNMIGTDVTGKFAVGNKSWGISVGSTGSLLVIGGSAAGARNIISGNGYSGISIYQDNSTVVQNNYIGTDVTGKKALPNLSSGIMMISSFNTIGGGGANEGNVISANGGSGIYLSWSASYQTTGSSDFVLGNLIGVGADGTTPLGNKDRGVYVLTQGTTNVIGGQGKSRNVIANNGAAGVEVASGTTVLISGNSISANGLLGIDLNSNGATKNDLGDGDSGANNLQNYPVLSSASLISNGLTFVNGTLNSASNTKFTVEFFSNNAADASGFGEGQNYLGALNVTTDANGNGSFTGSFAGLSAGQCISTTATDPSNNTSEFSLCRQIVLNTPGSVQFTSAAYSVGENGSKASITAKRTGGNFGTVTAQYATAAGGTATAGSDYNASSGILSWGDGDSSDKTFTIPIIDNSASNSNKTVNVGLSNVTNGATLGSPAGAVLTILDDESYPKGSIIDVSQAEGNSGTTNFMFTVSLSVASSQTIKVDYSTNDVTALSPADYQENIGTLTFAPGETSKQIAVGAKGDTQFEPDETFTVDLSNFVNAIAGKTSGLGTIVNDDAKSSGSTTIQFGQATYNVQEDLTSMNVTVTRTGDSTGSSTVDYKTVDGTAKQKSDFEYAAGTITFGPGETDKTISLLINEDMFLEGNETFSLALSNATGAVIGSQASTDVTIVDDASEPAASPLDDAQAFVYTHYHDFLNREPDAAGLAFWTNQITACGSDATCADAARANVSAAFYLSIEFQQTGYLLYLMQKESYGTMPKYASYMRDLQQVSRGVVVNAPGWQALLADNQQHLAREWVERPEFKAKYDSMSNAQYVSALYANAGIVAPQIESDALVARLDNAAEDRALALLDVANNAAFQAQEKNTGFVMMEYFGYLRRDPDASPDADQVGFNFWLNKLNQFGGNYFDAEMVRAFIISTEYRQRFGQ